MNTEFNNAIRINVRHKKPNNSAEQNKFNNIAGNIANRENNKMCAVRSNRTISGLAKTYLRKSIELAEYLALAKAKHLNNRIVGYHSYYPYKYRGGLKIPNVIYLDSGCVETDFRGSKYLINKRLFEEANKQFKELGYKYMTLSALPSAVNSWRRLGFMRAQPMKFLQYIKGEGNFNSNKLKILKTLTRNDMNGLNEKSKGKECGEKINGCFMWRPI